MRIGKSVNVTYLICVFIQPPLSSEKAAKMEELYHFNAATNSEIRFRYSLCASRNVVIACCKLLVRYRHIVPTGNKELFLIFFVKLNFHLLHCELLVLLSNCVLPSLNNNNNNNQIYMVPYSCSIRGAGGRSDQCSVKA